MAAVTWEVWKQWTPARRAKYRADHRKEWDKFRPRSASSTQPDPSGPAQPDPVGPAPPAPAAPPPVAPFLTSRDIGELDQFLFDFNLQIGIPDQGIMGELDQSLASGRAQTEFQKSESDRTAQQGTARATDEAIGRGLFQSSIRDADLADVNRANASRKSLLDTAFRNLEIDVDRRKRLLLGARDKFQENMNRRAVENAAAVPPTPAPPAPPTAPATQALAQPQSQGPGVSWAVWNRWDAGQRGRYRDRHRNEWDTYRPR